MRILVVGASGKLTSLVAKHLYGLPDVELVCWDKESMDFDQISVEPVDASNPDSWPSSIFSEKGQSPDCIVIGATPCPEPLDCPGESAASTLGLVAALDNCFPKAHIVYLSSYDGENFGEWCRFAEEYVENNCEKYTIIRLPHVVEVPGGRSAIDYIRSTIRNATSVSIDTCAARPIIRAKVATMVVEAVVFDAEANKNKTLYVTTPNNEWFSNEDIAKIARRIFPQTAINVLSSMEDMYWSPRVYADCRTQIIREVPGKQFVTVKGLTEDEIRYIIENDPKNAPRVKLQNLMVSS